LSKKRTALLLSSLAAIPLGAVLVAASIHKGRHKSSLQTNRSRQTRSKAEVSTTVIIDPNNDYKQQDKEESQIQSRSPFQDSEIRAYTITSNNSNNNSTNGTVTTTNTIPVKTTTTTGKDTVTPTAPPLPRKSSSVYDKAVISSPQTPTQNEISVSDEARKTGESLKELFITALKEARDSAKETGKRIKSQTIDITTSVDSKDVRALGDNVDIFVKLFDETMTEIRKEHFDEQIKLFESYKDLIQAHVKVVDARCKMASKLKPGS
jgi:hypothetical protein